MRSFYYYTQLIKHYGSATLIDVLHSPFVFALYNDCVKKNSNVHLPDFVPQSKGYMNQRVEIILAKFRLQHPNHLYASHPGHIVQGIRVIYILTKDTSLIALQKVLLSIHNDSIIIMKDMYHSKEIVAHWEGAKQLNGVTASVDLFFVGFIFVRKEQRKQDFRLRLF